MRNLILILCGALACQLSSFAASKEILELNRAVLDLQDQVRTLQRTVDEKMGSIGAQVTQALDSANKGNTSVAVLQNTITAKLNEIGTGLASPVANLGSKVDQMATEFQNLRGSIDDLNSRMGKLQGQVNDMNNTLKVMQAPPAPPASTGGGVGGSGPPPGMNSQDLFNQAKRDESMGNLDLALSGYQQFLKFYDNTDQAPVAQFQIGQIYYNKGDFANAANAFDACLERYAENEKTPDAMYMKGMALWRGGEPTAAGKEFLNVIQKYPRNPLAAKAREARKQLGYNTPPAAAPTSTRKKKG